MAICRFSLSRGCPVKSARRRGRSPASNCCSSSLPRAETSRASGHQRTSSSALRNSGSNSSGAPLARALRIAASAAGRAQPRFSSAESTSSSSAKGRRRRRLVAARGRGQLVAQFQHHALRRLLSDARECAPALDLAAPDGRQQIRASIPLRTLIASPGPILLTPISFSNRFFSSCVRKPKSASASSRT